MLTLQYMSRIGILLIFALWISLPASAQPGIETVSVLYPDTYQVPEGIGDRVYEALMEAIDDHTNYESSDLPPQTLDDLLFAIGCVGDRMECTTNAGEILETDLLLWGSVAGSGDAYLVEFVLWDVSLNSARYHYSKGIEGDLDTLYNLLPVLTVGVTHGSVGIFSLRISPADAHVELDSSPMFGSQPYRATGLELGPHIIRVTHPDYYEYRETIVIGLVPETIEVNLIPTTEEIEVTSGRLWTWIALTSSVAFSGTGVAFALLTESSQNNFDNEADRIQLNIDELNNLQEEGERNALLSNLFFGAGAGSLVMAVVLFFLESDSGNNLDDDNAQDTARTRISPHPRGLTLDIEF
jgi:hypothetical protein